MKNVWGYHKEHRIWYNGYILRKSEGQYVIYFPVGRFSFLTDKIKKVTNKALEEK